MLDKAFFEEVRRLILIFEQQVEVLIHLYLDVNFVIASAKLTIAKFLQPTTFCPPKLCREREDLSILEYLIRPQAKPSNGVYGGGWERPSNVFMAARTFKREQEEQQREQAVSHLRMGAFWRLWS